MRVIIVFPWGFTRLVFTATWCRIVTLLRLRLIVFRIRMNCVLCCTWVPVFPLCGLALRRLCRCRRVWVSFLLCRLWNDEGCFLLWGRVGFVGVLLCTMVNFDLAVRWGVKSASIRGDCASATCCDDTLMTNRFGRRDSFGGGCEGDEMLAVRVSCESVEEIGSWSDFVCSLGGVCLSFYKLGCAGPHPYVETIEVEVVVVWSGDEGVESWSTSAVEPADYFCVALYPCDAACETSVWGQASCGGWGWWLCLLWCWCVAWLGVGVGVVGADWRG